MERFELQPLSLPEVSGLVEHVLAGPVHSLSSTRLWQQTQGNALYLRHLLDGEVAAGRIARHAGMWMWDGQPAVSPALAEFVDTQIGRAPASVRAVLRCARGERAAGRRHPGQPHRPGRRRRGRSPPSGARRRGRAPRGSVVGADRLWRGTVHQFTSTAETARAHRDGIGADGNLGSASAITTRRARRRLGSHARPGALPQPRRRRQCNSWISHSPRVARRSPERVDHRPATRGRMPGDRLMMSIRSVEGHLFRASQRVGATAASS